MRSQEFACQDFACKAPAVRCVACTPIANDIEAMDLGRQRAKSRAGMSTTLGATGNVQNGPLRHMWSKVAGQRTRGLFGLQAARRARAGDDAQHRIVVPRNEARELGGRVCAFNEQHSPGRHTKRAESSQCKQCLCMNLTEFETNQSSNRHEAGPRGKACSLLRRGFVARCLRRSVKWEDLARPCVVLGIAIVLSVAASIGLGGNDGAGYAQRAFAILEVGLIAAVALRVMRIAQDPDGNRPMGGPDDSAISSIGPDLR